MQRRKEGRSARIQQAVHDPQRGDLGMQPVRSECTRKRTRESRWKVRLVDRIEIRILGETCDLQFGFRLQLREAEDHSEFGSGQPNPFGRTRSHGPLIGQFEFGWGEPGMLAEGRDRIHERLGILAGANLVE